MASQAEQLRQAAAAGQVDKVRELCKAGAKIDPDLEGRTALHLASANGHLAVVKILISSGAKVNARDAAGYSPLHQGATEGHEEVVVLLLKSGCHVDTQDELHGNTALHEAAWKGYSRTVAALCKNKANVYIKNNGGFTPLHLTCQNGHNQSCRILLLSACKPDVRNSYGDTPLHTAARYGHAGVLRILISAFCAVSEVNKNGDTALHIAAAMGKRKLTKILLEANCDHTTKNNQAETARDIAHRKGFDEVVAILDNPPVTLIPVRETEKGHKKANSTSKKMEKDSGGTSQESSSKDKKDKSKKSKKKQSVHFLPDGKKNGNTSPYGCHMYPNLEFFPSIKMKSLPPEPLQKGEQYYADLAGNIKKGPRGLGYMCYCSPFFDHVEKKLDSNKKELLKHIDDKNEDLKAKINHLEQRTHDQLFNMNQRMKETLAFERGESSERMDRCLLRERLELQNRQENSIRALRDEMKSLVNQNHRHMNGSAIRSSQHSYQMPNGYPISRSKSADLLSETDSHQWSTDINSNARMETPLSNRNGNFINGFRQRFTGGMENGGAKPKHFHPQSPKVSRWKAKCYGNSIYTRDSRSENDLTSCHTELDDDRVSSKLNGPVLKNRSGQVTLLGVIDGNSTHQRFQNESNHTHNHVGLGYNPKMANPGQMWNSTRPPVALRPSVQDNYRQTAVNPQSNPNRSSDYYRVQQPNKSFIECDKDSPYKTIPTNRSKQECTTETNSNTENLAYRNMISQHTNNSDVKRDTITQPIGIEADGSSFV